jgi:hypothetical protein
MTENSHHPDCPELSIEADECGVCPYLRAAQTRAWGDLQARAKLAADMALQMGLSTDRTTQMVTAASNAYAEGFAEARSRARDAVRTNCHQQRHAVAGLGHVMICPSCYSAFTAIDALTSN